MKKQLEELKSKLERIQGEWDGDLSGIKKDRAHAAGEAIEAIDLLIPRLEELNID